LLLSRMRRENLAPGIGAPIKNCRTGQSSAAVFAT
jgi:hypothetical protein